MDWYIKVYMKVPLPLPVDTQIHKVFKYLQRDLESSRNLSKKSKLSVQNLKELFLLIGVL